MANYRGYSEHQLQASIFDYVTRVLPSLRPFMFAIPNGGKRDIGTAIKLRKEGVTPGVPDIFISIPSYDLHGCYIELKVGKNTLTEAQKEFRERIEAIGYVHAECRSLEEFIGIIEDYFIASNISDSVLHVILNNLREYDED